MRPAGGDAPVTAASVTDDAPVTATNVIDANVIDAEIGGSGERCHKERHQPATEADALQLRRRDMPPTTATSRIGNLLLWLNPLLSTTVLWLLLRQHGPLIPTPSPLPAPAHGQQEPPPPIAAERAPHLNLKRSNFKVEVEAAGDDDARRRLLPAELAPSRSSDEHRHHASVLNLTKEQQQQQRQRQRGYHAMRARSTVITGIARNNAQHLSATLALVDAIGALFASYAVVLYENDSTDETPAMIEAWRAANRGGAARIDFISEQLNTVFPMDLGGFAEERFRLLADCRNKCLDVLRGAEYDEFSHVIVLDMDLYDFDLDGLAHSFGAHDAWDAVSANGYYMLGDEEYYYDTLAFRTAEFPDTWHSDAQRDAAHRSYDEAMPLVPVNSAFGGLAVYKRRCLVQCRYTGLDCEHVALHHCLQQTTGCRRLFMNPAMKLNYHLWD